MRPPLRIAFLHPSLGFGGAERLVVNAARHLRRAGHHVTLFTASYDPRWELERGDDAVEVRVRGTFIPTQIGSRMQALCTIGRMAYLAVAAARTSPRFDLIFCDVVPHIVPLLKRLSAARVIFYCHYPDQLQAAADDGALYARYRTLLARGEIAGLRLADRVVVNSRFTEAAVRRIVPGEFAIDLLYPAAVDERDDTGPDRNDARDAPLMLLSVNRFEQRKNLGLAIEALRLLRDRLPAAVFANVQLVLAGAIDERSRERNVPASLQALAHRYQLDEHVRLRPSCTEDERRALLTRCRCLVYTPSNEHFGLVPVEAMAAGRAVVAAASGGVLETVRHEETGLLCAPTPAAFADALERLILHPADAERMGQAGRRDAIAAFSRARFGATLDTIVALLS